MAKSYLDSNGVLYFWQKIKTYVGNRVPTKTSDLTNDSGYITGNDIPEGAAASTTTPKMDGTAANGAEKAFARGDHVHPTDTSRAPIASPTFTGNPTAPTQTAGNNSTRIATTAFVQTAISGKVDTSAIGAASGVCPLNASGTIDAGYLPSYVDDVIEAYAKVASGTLTLYADATTTTTITAEKGKIYIVVGGNAGYDASDLVDNQYRWSGSQYIKMADGGVSSISNAELDTITAS